jgi:hypothetical protein
MNREDMPLQIKETVTLRKFEGDVPEGLEDPEGAGFKLLEEIELVDGRIVSRKVFDGPN